MLIIDIKNGFKHRNVDNTLSFGILYDFTEKQSFHLKLYLTKNKVTILGGKVKTKMGRGNLHLAIFFNIFFF
jgi:hypothetical protein